MSEPCVCARKRSFWKTRDWLKMKRPSQINIDGNRDQVIELVFKKNFHPEAGEIPFTKADIVAAVAIVQKRKTAYRENNIPDIRYQYASGRRPLPPSVDKVGPWMIAGRGKGKYAFVKLSGATEVKIQEDLLSIALPDATPEIVLAYAGNDEQGILAKIHYNRLLDIFLQLTCYHLQNHWKTSLANRGQCEIDDLYVGLNTTGKQFVIPVESKSAGDHLNKTQIA